MLDSAGKIKWEKQLPTKFDTIDSTSILTASKSSLAFAGYRVVETELFRISSAGELTDEKRFSNNIILIQSSGLDEALQFHVNTINENDNEKQK